MAAGGARKGDHDAVRPGGRNGFTLIELLVVIAIIAIHAAILFPVFARARVVARSIQCLSGVRQIATAYSMYLEAWNSNMAALP